MLALPVNNPCLILHKFCIRQPLRCSSTTQSIRINSLLNYTCALCKLKVSFNTCQQATTSASNRRNSPALAGHGYVPFFTPAQAVPPIPPTLHQKPVAALYLHNCDWQTDNPRPPTALCRRLKESRSDWILLILRRKFIFSVWKGGSVNWFNTRLGDRFNEATSVLDALCTSSCNSSASHRSGCAKRKRIRVINFN